MNAKEHWEHVYSSRPIDQLGWFRPHLQPSLEWIGELKLNKDAAILDVGGGASTLVDDLLADGYQDITVLDLSGHALSSVRRRLGPSAERITWLEEDITTADLPGQAYDLWHDRAVFHFLTEPDQQTAYRDRLIRSLKPSGHAIIATFAPEAPPRCSGLPVQRYSAEAIKHVLGDAFDLERHRNEAHVTPGGVEQMYLYSQFRLR